ncbi:MAG: hypothetical protein ACYS1A_17730 [Planctomycetota bacterium]|jgi:hypothetical protein
MKETVKRYIKKLEAENNRQCRWTDDKDGVYYTECGERFEFLDGGPKENHCRYCQYCGGEVVSNGNKNKLDRRNVEPGHRLH